MSEPQIDHSWNGHASIGTDTKHYTPSNVSIDIWPAFGIVQAGLGDKWIREKRLAVDADYSFSVGDFDVTVTRKRDTGKILNMAEARRRRNKVRI